MKKVIPLALIVLLFCCQNKTNKTDSSLKEFSNNFLPEINNNLQEFEKSENL